MDAPNAPNQANPNAPDQFVDAIQGPANQAQGPVNNNALNWSKCAHAASTTTSSTTTRSCRSSGACSTSPSTSKVPLVQWSLPFKCFIKIG